VLSASGFWIIGQNSVSGLTRVTLLPKA
jgi:hypothetical protein